MSKFNALLALLGDENQPIEHRSQKLIDVLAGAEKGEPVSKQASEEIFQRLADRAVDDAARNRAKQLKDILDQLGNAPMRPGTFIQLSNITGGAAAHALVTLENGDMAFVVAHDQELARKLSLGDRVLIDASGKILLYPAEDITKVGVEARFERMVDSRHLEIVTQQDERHIVLAGPDLVGKIKAREVKPGAAIVVGSGGKLAVHALPPADKEADNFRFLDRGLVPDVVADRDIGSPPRVIQHVAKHIREEMTRPELRRRFKLRSCLTYLLSGVSGSGKTLSVQAIHRLMYEIMSEITGTPVDKLPPRVFRFKNSQMLSMWLGESDKNVDRIFDEVERMTTIPHTNDQGKSFKLPVLVIIEEIDGMARGRGMDHEGVHDRILTTMLQRLDPNRHGLSDNLVVFLATTNEPHMVDPAMLRRIGGSVETFGRLDQEGFVSVIQKHVAGLPAGNGHTHNHAKAWKSIIGDLADWLFVDGVDKGVVELAYQGHAAQSFPSVKYHRDFLTGALIDRSVQQAATEAWEISITKNPKAGITQEQLLRAIKCQVSAIARQLNPNNVSHYLDLPDGARVVGVKSILSK